MGDFHGGVQGGTFYILYMSEMSKWRGEMMVEPLANAIWETICILVPSSSPIHISLVRLS